MRKEILFAILAGAFLGVIIAFGIYRANSMITPATTSNSSKKTPLPTQALSLAIAKPENQDVLTEGPVQISGITRPAVWTTVSTDDTDYLTQSQGDGSFQESVDLNGGADQLLVSAIDPHGATAQQKLLVVFSTQFASNLTQATPSSTPESSSSSSSDTVRQKVLEAVQKALQNPKAYLGTVTDIAETTFQIKTASGEIQQVSTNTDQTTVIKMTKDTSNEINLTDIAIGDFIVAMGFKNNNNVLDTRRILVTSEPQPLSLSVNIVKVKNSDPKHLEAIELSTNKTLTIVPGDSLIVYQVKNGNQQKENFVDINNGDTVISIGTSGETSIAARTIFDIVQAPAPAPSQ